MWSLITDCDEFMKFKDKEFNITLYFNKENNKIVSVEAFDNEYGGGFTIKDVNKIDPYIVKCIDNKVLNFINQVLETEKER